ncbi:3-hydroxyacyl-CoA dehydrogenase NAD-binding domain-containing protein [Falsiroseomonas stagni]|uniref:3-hydroxyacyl-CoA dehydrogenase n=1 Tax=Falsiroseomonas stagni DSM 19981 TaxID=1123062 RepID=A0A1I3Z508_9PROT|nr:3-hydroxyacyl-CoA dehydrogenase NAD-binding domain-containing protein [Falsiroseomonas stagni]SFK38751.1 3-hydroxyacyl-CoA dehydrogenase [Falsiroseomonas stagni DSM 19981]
MAELVRFEVVDGIGVATLSNPPVNALSAALRAALFDAVKRAEADASVRALVIAAEGRTFIAGADISEFGKPPASPTLAELVAALDGCAKPVVAAIHAAALGGGLEVAMACTARVLGPKASLGLPEVKLGLLPGSGGTQRAPRLMGAVAALKLMVAGDPLPAKAAVEAGLADAVAEGDLVAAARAHAAGLADGKRSKPVSARDEGLGSREEFEAEAAKLAGRAKDEPQIADCIACVRACFDMPFVDGVAFERAAFLRLLDDPRSKALRHVFFAEREAAKIAGVPAGTKPREVKRAAVLGSGTMGAGIAMCFANAGIPVRVIETDAAASARGIERIRGTYEASVKRGSLTGEARDARMALIEGSVGLESAADADLVVEAIFEDLDLKKQVFATLDRVTKPGTVLASNTSYLDIDAMAAVTSRPGDVLGMHFFSPANVMKLLEIVRARHTSPEALATAAEIGRKLKKVPVVVGVCFGFVGNRMLAQRSRQAERLLLEGASPAQVDAALTGFGFKMGPFAMTDLAGLDIGWRVRKATGGRAPVADALVEAGRLGQKTQKGFYLYPQGARTGVADPDVDALIEKVASAEGVTRRAIDGDEILDRLVLPMVNEGARILEEGIAARPGDIDVVWLNGYNWPAWRGGPMHYADARGLSDIAARLSQFADQTGDESLRPAPLLARLAAEGKGFASLKAG